MALQPEELPVFLGFGGGHYVQRQTELIFGTAIAFGHLFSNYQVAELNRDVVDDVPANRERPTPILTANPCDPSIGRKL